MATKKEFIDYVMEQIRFSGDVRYKKMFGEYMVYANEKPVLLVCDDSVFVKILPETTAALPDAIKGYPYDGAKEHYVLDPDDGEKLSEIISVLVDVLPDNKKKGNKTYYENFSV